METPPLSICDHSESRLHKEKVASGVLQAGGGLGSGPSSEGAAQDQSLHSC